jgi:hypothetical protein
VAQRGQGAVRALGREEAPQIPSRHILQKHALDRLLGAKVKDLPARRLDGRHGEILL